MQWPLHRSVSGQITNSSGIMEHVLSITEQRARHVWLIITQKVLKVQGAVWRGNQRLGNISQPSAWPPPATRPDTRNSEPPEQEVSSYWQNKECANCVCLLVAISAPPHTTFIRAWRKVHGTAEQHILSRADWHISSWERESLLYLKCVIWCKERNFYWSCPYMVKETWI
jgi:hypothetical protein